jgi:Phospholipase_D-nuclease N-terminal
MGKSGVERRVDNMPHVGMQELLILLVPLVVVLQLGIQIYALVDAVRVPDDSYYQAGTKLIWVLVIIFFGCLGGLIYLLAGRPRRP